MKDTETNVVVMHKANFRVDWLYAAYINIDYITKKWGITHKKYVHWESFYDLLLWHFLIQYTGHSLLHYETTIHRSVDKQLLSTDQCKRNVVILKLWHNNNTYPSTIREATPKEVRSRSTNSILNCISENTSYKNRIEQSWKWIHTEITIYIVCEWKRRKAGKKWRIIPKTAWCKS